MDMISDQNSPADRIRPKIELALGQANRDSFSTRVDYQESDRFLACGVSDLAWDNHSAAFKFTPAMHQGHPFFSNPAFPYFQDFEINAGINAPGRIFAATGALHQTAHHAISPAGQFFHSQWDLLKGGGFKYSSHQQHPSQQAGAPTRTNFCFHSQVKQTGWAGRIKPIPQIFCFAFFNNRKKIDYMAKDDLPFVFINVACSADGKIAPANRRFIPFGSKRDQELMLELRAEADAVMAGARTIEVGEISLGPGPAKYRKQRLEKKRAEYNLRVIVSGSGTLNPKAHIFEHRYSPIIVLTTALGQEHLKKNKVAADEIKACGEKDLDFREALRWLRKQWDVRSLLCEGGGEVNAGLFEAGLVDEVYLTLVPIIIGGRFAPTLADGLGVAKVEGAAQLELTSLKKHGSELFLVYRVQRQMQMI